jgi:hypothetical protein
MSEAFEAASKSFTTPASLTWCARSSPDELLQRQNLVSVTRFACGRPHLLGREPDETSHSMPSPLAPAGFDSGPPEARRQHMRQTASPPSQLHGAVRHWLGLTHGEILAAIEQHFAEHHRLYTSGSGDGNFHLVQAAVRRAWEAKHPPRPRADDEPERPRRRAGGVRKVYTAAGVADAIVEGRASRLLRDPVSNIERPSGLVGYEQTGEPIGEDEEGGMMRVRKGTQRTSRSYGLLARHSVMSCS